MAQLVPEFLLRGLGPRINVLRRPAAVRAGAERISISDVEVLSSYNWVNPAHPPTIMVPGGPGHGITFEEHVSDYPKGLEGSISHWRILRYRLGPLKCVVRYEADATKYPYGDCSGQRRVVLPAPDDRSATVVLRGHLTPQADTIEIKCFGHDRPLAFNTFKPEIWAGCTGHMLLGRHVDGLLEQVILAPMLEKTMLWESAEPRQTAFRMLPHLISDLKEAVRAAPGRQAALIFRPYPLQLVEVYDAGPKPDRLVSEYMVNKFWGGRKKKPARAD
ncbi:hypothetical protein PG984_008372 [Apiospora sp. TS-2023a]